MGGGRTYLVLFVILTLVQFRQCRRSGGGSRGGSRGSSSRGSSHTSYHAPSYHAPSYHAPSYNSPPAHSSYPSYSPPSYNAPSYSNPYYRSPPAPSRPRPPAYEHPAHAVTSNPVRSNRPGISTARPHVYAGSSARPRIGSTPRPAGPTSGTRYVGSTRRNTYSGTTPRPHHFTSARPVGFAQLPPAPGRGPVGPPRYGSTYGNSHYGGGYSGPQNVKIVNKYNYHYPGYYSVPVAQYHYPGYFHTQSYYSYGTHDTGSTALGFYLGYSLARLSTPTYSHYSFYDGYSPRYDHYTVHHYYHNKDSVPQRQEIQSNTIIGCVGDAAQICPANTTSLCTSNGALMCVASAISTVACSDNKNVNCVTSTISCVNNTAPECKDAKQSTTTISIPCVSKAEVYGELKTVNNTIIPKNATLPTPPPINGTNVTTTGTNSTTDATNSTTNSTNATNSTTTSTNSTAANNTAPAEVLVTQYTQVPEIETTTVAQKGDRRKRDAAQDYCVTILALPAKREQTQGEEFLKDARAVAEMFIESAWDL